MDGSFVAGLLVWYAVFLFSSTLHEACHAVAAARGGDYTAYNAGQATLNPLPHIKREKLGMVVVPLVTFFLNHGTWMIGWASAPYNPYWAARYPKKSFIMSLAGPLSHILPVTVAWLGLFIGFRTGYFTPFLGYGQLAVAADGSAAAGALAMFLGVLLQLNIILLIFNLLPIPPMDGSEVWNLFIKTEEGRLRWRMTLKSYSLAGLMLAWFVFPRVFWPIWQFVVLNLYRLGTGIPYGLQ